MPADLEAIFHRAMELAGEARAAFLDEACAGNAELRQSVERLLAANEKAEEERWMGEPALVAVARREAEAPLQVARYRILERIGAGGMGVVYKAVRADDTFSKVVALKTIQPFGAETALVERFQMERRILAMLDHANVARILDAGATEDGLPFLVMEYVDGLPLLRYLEERKAGQRERVELFLQLCAGVAHAHRHLIVHRDLKPSNILVTAEGAPKLLDFGVAKLLDGVTRTATGAAMTPQYASPEQIRDEPVTTASDIYSLGAILYELLGGRPLVRSGSSPLEAARMIAEEAPAPMEGVEEELQNIVMLALRKEPGRRYGTVEELAADLRRWLGGYPVLARGDSAGYRARKFVGRHRVAVGLGVLLVISVAAGVAATVHEARKAQRRFADVRRLANSLLFDIHPAIESLPGATAARRLVVKEALTYLDRLSKEGGADAELDAEVAAAYERVGIIQGMPNTPNLGDPKGAIASFQKAAALLDPLVQRGGKVQMDAANVRLRLGYVYMFSGEVAKAAENERVAVGWLESVVARGGDAGMMLLARRSLMDGYAVLADVTGNPNMPNLGRTEEAVALQRKALEMNLALAKEFPGDRKIGEELAGRYNQLGQLEQALNHGDGAVAAFEKGYAVAIGLVEAESAQTTYLRSAAVIGRNLALVCARLKQDWARAARYAGESHRLYEKLARNDRANVEAQFGLFESTVAQGWVMEPKRAGEAVRIFDAALGMFAELRRGHPSLDPTRARTAYQLRAEARLQLGDTAGAIADAERELELDAVLLGRSAANAGAVRNQALAYAQIGRAHEMRGEKGVARDWYRRSVETYEGQRKAGLLIPMYLGQLEAARAGLGRCEAGN